MTYTDPRVTHRHPAGVPTGATFWSRPQAAVGPPPMSAPPMGPPPMGPPPMSPPPLASLPQRPRRSRALGVRVVAGFLAASIVLGGGGAYALSGPSTTAVQPVSFAGDAPFTAPVGTDQPDVAGSDATGAQDGTAAGTFASSEAPACDGDRLVAGLQADPAKAAAWAEVAGITADRIPAYVQSLSPAVLRADTAVTDHGFRGGRFTESPAVLAKGTAVFVSSYGQPTVKCFNGNPLTPPSSPPVGVAVVTPGATAVRTIVFSSTDGERQVSQPAPQPVGPTPAQIAAAQQARDDADAAARGAVALRTKADAADRASTTATATAAADLQAARNAQATVGGAGTKVSRIEFEIRSAEADLANPLTPLWFRRVLEKRVADLRTTALPAAQDALRTAEQSRDAAKAKSDASAAEAAARKAEADRAKKDAEQAQTDAEKAEAAAREKEKSAGLPTPDQSKQENADQDQAKLREVTAEAERTDTTTTDPATTDPTKDDPTKDVAAPAGPAGLPVADPTVVADRTTPGTAPATVTESGTGAGGTTSTPDESSSSSQEDAGDTGSDSESSSDT